MFQRFWYFVTERIGVILRNSKFTQSIFSVEVVI